MEIMMIEEGWECDDYRKFKFIKCGRKVLIIKNNNFIILFIFFVNILVYNFIFIDL